MTPRRAAAARSVSSARIRAVYSGLANAPDLVRLAELVHAAKRELSAADWERLQDVDFLAGSDLVRLADPGPGPEPGEGGGPC